MYNIYISVYLIILKHTATRQLIPVACYGNGTRPSGQWPNKQPSGIGAFPNSPLFHAHANAAAS